MREDMTYKTTINELDPKYMELNLKVWNIVKGYELGILYGRIR